MLNLEDILKPRHVDLHLDTVDVGTAIAELARHFEGDAGMLHLEAFQAALKDKGTLIEARSLLSHLRTDHVSTMLLAAGRLPEANGHGVRLLFLIAVPKTLAGDYLRLVGALARSLRNPAIMRALLATESAEEFVRILCAEAAAM